jgi:hypothetical protein
MMTHDARLERPAPDHPDRPLENDPRRSGPVSGGTRETDEYGLPVARPGHWLPDLDGDFELVDL